MSLILFPLSFCLLCLSGLLLLRVYDRYDQRRESDARKNQLNKGEKEKHSSEPKSGTLARSRDPSAAGAGAARARGGRGRRRRLERAKAGPAPHDSPAAAQRVSNLFCPPGFVNTSALRLKSAAFSSPPPGAGPLSQQDFQVHASSASPLPPVRIHIFSFLLMHSVMQALTPRSSQPAFGFRSNCIQQSFGAIEPWLLVS